MKDAPQVIATVDGMRRLSRRQAVLPYELVRCYFHCGKVRAAVRYAEVLPDIDDGHRLLYTVQY